jgi:hypothetical protein
MFTVIGKKSLSPALLLFLMISCGDGYQFSSGTGTKNADANKEDPDFNDELEEVTDEFTVTAIEKEAPPVDVIFLIDTSGSMKEELGYLADNMQTFMDEFTKQNIKNQQLYIVADTLFTMPTTVDPTTYVRYLNTVYSRDSLDIYYSLLTQGKFRPGVKREVIVVSDDNMIWQRADTTVGKGPADFVAALNAGMGPEEVKNLTINGFLALPSSKESPTCTIASQGFGYFELAGFEISGTQLVPTTGPKLLPNQGLLLDLCLKDWKGMVTELAKNIAKKEVQYTYTLSAAIVEAETVVVKIGDEELPSDHYSIDYEKNEITFKKDMAPAAGKSFKVIYTTKVKNP